MTHAELSELCIRPAGIPPSQCRGKLDHADSHADQAQEGEGLPHQTVVVIVYRCSLCRTTVAVAHGADGWYQRNEHSPSAVAVPIPRVTAWRCSQCGWQGQPEDCVPRVNSRELLCRQCYRLGFAHPVYELLLTDLEPVRTA